MTLDDNSSIYVGGLPYDISEEGLRRVFYIYGAVLAVKVSSSSSSSCNSPVYLFLLWLTIWSSSGFTVTVTCIYDSILLLILRNLQQLGLRVLNFAFNFHFFLFNKFEIPNRR